MSLGLIRVLLLGSGSREHAIAIALAQSSHLEKLYCAPGNPGIGEIAELVNLSILDREAVSCFCIRNDIALVVVGPEEPLYRGVSDALRARGIFVFGPSKVAARIEGDKSFAKWCMKKRWGVRTANYRSAYSLNDARLYSKGLGYPRRAVFWKANGSTAGKGVYPVRDANQMAEASYDLFTTERFGVETLPVIIEEGVFGTEMSIFALVSGADYLIVSADAQDFKRRDENNTGPNTGGMGAQSPSPHITAACMATIEKEIVKRTVDGMRLDNIHYQGVLFFGCVATPHGSIYTYEYNVRWGDPETQVILPRIKSDVLELFMAVATGNLKGCSIEVDPQVAICVVLAGPDYPRENGREAGEIFGLEDAKQCDVTILHAATRFENGKLLGGKGRVFSICARGNTIAECIQKAYAATSKIRFENGMTMRKDIGR